MCTLVNRVLYHTQTAKCQISLWILPVWSGLSVHWYIINPCLAEPGYALSFENSVDPDQLASEEANWSGSALFVIQYVNLHQQLGSSNWTGWKFEVGVTS